MLDTMSREHVNPAAGSAFPLDNEALLTLLAALDRDQIRQLEDELDFATFTGAQGPLMRAISETLATSAAKAA